MTDTNLVIDRDYRDNFSIKQTAIDKLGPKYFDDVDLAGLNVGALGFTLEQIANITEDAFNTASILINEAFPNKAIIPESLYSHAAVFQIDNTFTGCAACSFAMMLRQDEVLKYGTERGNIVTFYLDKDTIISVEDIPFTLDYTIKIEAQKKNITGYDVEYNYSARYVVDSNNSISTINDPYIKVRKTDNGYLLLQILAHQVKRTTLYDNIISNTKINYPVLDFEFDGALAGFDIFYKSPSSKDYAQLEKKINFSLPLKTPFCYYRLKDENILEISFCTRDGYFQPDFNSDIKVILYNTLGKGGNFDSYNGTKISFTMNDETYDYNRSLTIAAKTVSDSAGGNTALSLEALQALTVESYSTVTELSTESDIQTYFYNYKYRYGNEILVIKRRDDITERLFSAFLLIKNGDYIYPTNTMFTDLTTEDFDVVEENQFILRPGHVFIYKDGSNDTAVLVKDIMSYDKEKVAELSKTHPFIYTNPFLISVTKTPNIVGLYKTVCSQTQTLDFMTSNNDSFTQFITTKMNIQRGLDSECEYELSLSISPSVSMDPYIETLNGYKDNDVRIFAGFVSKDGSGEVGYMELLPTNYDSADKSIVRFATKLKTNDSITSDGLIPILNMVKTNDKSDYAYISIANVKVNIYIMYFDGIATSNEFMKYFEDMLYYTNTNIYSTSEGGLDFISPLNMMRSTVTFSNAGTSDTPLLGCNLSLLPMVKADIVNDVDSFNVFINRVTSNYEYLGASLPLLRNNTHLDIKFYNTYGKSINYTIGDSNELIDKVNLEIKFKVTLVSGFSDADVRDELKDFIKTFIEQIKTSGTNDLYISNLISEIENNFASVHHLKFLGINNYTTDYQTISVIQTNLDDLTKEDRRRYVPEMLVANRSDINLSII